MRWLWRCTVSIIFAATVILLTQISLILIFKKSFSEPWKTVVTVITVSLIFILAVTYESFQRHRFLKGKSQSKNLEHSQGDIKGSRL